MKRHANTTATPCLLGVECGGTQTVAAWANLELEPGALSHFGPANLQLLSDPQLVARFREISHATPAPAALAIGMAGARTEADFRRIREAAARVWPEVPCRVTNDLETALEAALEPGALGATGTTPAPRGSLTRVLVLSGTGSCCFGKTPRGRSMKIGGWGHILGDKGSGYEIGLRALKAVVYYYDRDGVWSGLGREILRALQLNEPNDLISWVQHATKTEIAARAVQVFEASKRGDGIARDILKGAASTLAKDAVACARRLAKPGAPVRFILSGSVLLKQPSFAKEVARGIVRLWPRSIVAPLKRESVWGAVQMAHKEFSKGTGRGAKPGKAAAAGPVPRGGRPAREGAEVWNDLSSSPTEARNPHSLHLDQLPLADAIALMLGEDAKVPAAVLKEKRQIERAVTLIVRAFRQGGRLFYVGAGTSGRLGVLDASECPPTFRTSPSLVQGIIAGGQRALWEAVEGAEDDAAAGEQAMQFRGVRRSDVVVGIAASGRTPFVWGALRAAKARGATTILVCFNPCLKIPRDHRPDLVIAPHVGPEILTGSTRLKAGTATKLILNIFTTLAMVRLGKVLGNLMIDVNASNTKLRDRATRMVREISRVDYTTAREALEKSAWKIKAACASLKTRA